MELQLKGLKNKVDSSLKLKAFDEEGLTIISSLCKDSVIKINEFGYEQESKRFAILMNRFCHEKENNKRIRSALHFDYVQKIKTKNIDTKNKDETLVMLAVRFEVASMPSGSIIIEFSGNKAINLTIENIEVFLTDIGDSWVTNRKPDHDVD